MTPLPRHAAALLVLAAIAVPATAQTAKDERRADAAAPAGGRCTTDDLIHAEVSDAVTATVSRLVTPIEKGSALRDAARLHLPCGFRLDARSGGRLVLTDGRTFRRYAENNAFGFAPAFGFSGAVTRSYTLAGQPIADATLRPENCVATIARLGTHLGTRLDRCAGFGSATAFFAATARHGTLVAHYVLGPDGVTKDFDLARVAGSVAALAFIPPPDAPGGTVTLFVEDRGALYRVYVDSPGG